MVSGKTRRMPEIVWRFFLVALTVVLFVLAVAGEAVKIFWRFIRRGRP